MNIKRLSNKDNQELERSALYLARKIAESINRVSDEGYEICRKSKLNHDECLLFMQTVEKYVDEFEGRIRFEQ